ncbi:hypothetical protein E2562_012798 [Oryza meyeriana var. granulata]|uniref:protein-serine/threonine phosphatase n=1 Tax=Oryza meyeriana var. granulata TaxID=110450 RepID=A0A6G1DHN6_9ORYZ|nr:hypothetical protein E2562_012798 [Oryza meyeriana var. granulata]
MLPAGRSPRRRALRGGVEGAAGVLLSGTSRVVGCFAPADKAGVNLEFLEPLDEGLGHSFCYVRPGAITDSPVITPSNSERYTLDSSVLDSETRSGSFRQEVVDDLAAGLQRPSKSFSETTFRTISGASVSANASSARTGNLCVSLAGDVQEPAAAFESTASFAAVPLQPVPRGSGPLNTFLSGPLERGFASGPLDKGAGFMSGPLDKGVFMSGPIDSGSKSNFSAPLSYGWRKAGLGQLVRSISRPMKSALSRTFSRRSQGPGWVQRFLLHPMAQLSLLRDAKCTSEGSHNGLEAGLPEPEYSVTRNLQWAHGKAGEDRVHVVLSEEQGWLFIGIYDGFSGPDAPDFLMSNLYKAIDKELEGLLWVYEDSPERSAHEFTLGEGESVAASQDLPDGGGIQFQTDNAKPEQLANSEKQNVSSVKISDEGALQFHLDLNTGGQRDLVSQVSSNQKLDASEIIEEKEVSRIRAEHPDDPQSVFNDRVKGQLKVTRAFGAGFLKKPKFNDILLEMFRIDYVGTSAYISCNPAVLHHRLCSNDRFLVLSSDGLYQYFSNDEVVSHVAWFMENVPEGDPAQYLVAELLCRAAKKNGMDFHELLDIPQGDRRKYHDDVSVMYNTLILPGKGSGVRHADAYT